MIEHDENDCVAFSLASDFRMHLMLRAFGERVDLATRRHFRSDRLCRWMQPLRTCKKCFETWRMATHKTSHRVSRSWPHPSSCSRVHASTKSTKKACWSLAYFSTYSLNLESSIRAMSLGSIIVLPFLYLGDLGGFTLWVKVNKEAQTKTFWNSWNMLKYLKQTKKMMKIKSVHFVSSQPATASSRISSSQASRSSEASP